MPTITVPFCRRYMDHLNLDYSCKMESFKVTLVRWLAEMEWTQASVYTAKYSFSNSLKVLVVCLQIIILQRSVLINDHSQDTDVVLPVGAQGTRRPEGQRNHQAGGRSWKEDFGNRPNKEPPLDLSGPRARLYMPVDKVVAGCGKSGSAFEENIQRTGRGSSLEDCSKTERRAVYEGNPRPEVGNRNAPFRTPPTQQSPPHAPLGQGFRQHRASSGPLLPGGGNHQPNRSVRLQPGFPVEKKSKRLPFKSVPSEKAATQTYSMSQRPAPPVVKKPVVGDFSCEAKSDAAQVGVTLDSFDLLDQLEVAVAESLGAGKEMVAKAVADSWRNQVCFYSINWNTGISTNA